MSIKTKGWLYIGLPIAIVASLLITPAFVEINEPYISLLSAIFAIFGVLAGFVFCGMVIYGAIKLLDAANEKQSH